MDKFILNQPVHSPADMKAANLPYVLPAILRVRSIVRLPTSARLILNRATLYHDKAHFAIEWVTRHPDIRIRRNSLVSVMWTKRKPIGAEPFWADRLVLVERPRAEVNLFETVPPTLVSDRGLLARASKLWAALPRDFRHLFNGIFWNGERFLKYLVGPASLETELSKPSANFRHCVEVAEEAHALARCRGRSQVPIAIVAGLLHDAGKAEEFRFDRVNRCCMLSETGKLIGHRDRLQHWIVTAIATHRIALSEIQLTHLLHVLTAAPHAPERSRGRPARTLEAAVLLLADRFVAEGSQTYSQAANQSEFDGPNFRAG
jgi:3'-5' exoribonuclease